MTVTINRSDYIDLLNELQIIPKVIETEVEYDVFLAVTESLLHKQQNRTLAETALFVLLVKLIEDYEAEYHPLQVVEKIAPHQFLQHMMEAREIGSDSLMEILNVSNKLSREIFTGDQQINRSQALCLSDYFHVAASNFYAE